MAQAKKTSTRKNKSKSKSKTFKARKFSKSNLIIFAVIFASIAGYFIYKSFAASTNIVINSTTIDSAHSSRLCTNTISSGCYKVLTETSGSKSGKPVIRLALGNSSTPSKVSLYTNTLEDGIYRVCLITKTSSATTGSITAYKYNNGTVSTSIGIKTFSLPASNDYVKQPDTACLSGIIFNSSSSGLEFSVNNTGPEFTLGSIIAYKTGNIQSSGNGFVTVCGTKLCINGQTFNIHGATTYGTLDDPNSEVTLAKQGNINVLELVNFEKIDKDLASTQSEETWARADRLIAAAKQNGLHVILNLSGYYHSLRRAGRTPTTTDWGPFLSMIANRTNTVTGVKYKDEPTIVWVSLIGEAEAPGYSEPNRGTTQQLTDFFKRSMAQWRSYAPKVMVTTGGFSHLNDDGDPNNPNDGSGIDWRTIMADSGNPICSFEINSTDDRDITTPMVTNYCKNLGKPWFLAAWSACDRHTGYPFYLNGDSEMAAHSQVMYDIAKATKKAVYPAVGSDFWNLQEGTVHDTNCDINPNYPKTWNVVKSN